MEAIRLTGRRLMALTFLLFAVLALWMLLFVHASAALFVRLGELL